jgi:hypothetical protein
MKLHWLKKKPKERTGISWGVPWPMGTMEKEDSMSLKDINGNECFQQSWPMAFWPDGSVKWTGHAAVLEGDSDTYEISRNQTVKLDKNLLAKETTHSFDIDTGELQYSINKQGNRIINTVKRGDQTIATDGKLTAIRERRRMEYGVTVIREEILEGQIQHIELEQNGPVRAVIKIEGTHRILGSKDTFLPFVLRLYFYVNTTSVRTVHTLLYDGDPQKDFIKGVGIELSVSLTGEPWNRNIRISGDEGIFSEAAQLLLTRRHPNFDGLFQKQINGEKVILKEAKYDQLLTHVRQNAIWNDFKIIQDSSDHYKITKRTQEECSWVESTHGRRAKGLLYIGGENQGVSIGIKNFWEKFPSSLEVNHLSKSSSTIKAWFWSPDGEVMDFRHYDNVTHVVSAYEGFEEMRATPFGVANTSELFLQFYEHAPTNEELVDRIEEWQSPLLLVSEPEYYYSTRALGVWSLPDRSTPMKAKLEEQLDKAFQFYKNEIEQRRWYGYWNYGDVMHTYDPIRHQWRYDLGGFAWQNTELVPNIWLWYSFLRSGREDIFIMAEAMTRHTSEVDCYHFGDYAGLGSRHNVVHWGCGCKEARISMAGLHKYYYFLTTDERTRDLLSEVKDADQALATLDPMREFYTTEEFPTHARIGPDWAAFCSNWLSEWERTEKKEYKEKIIHGINTLKKLPFRLLSGPTLGYDPKTSTLLHMGDGNEGGYHMVIAFGAPQVWMEIDQLLGEEEWEKMLAEFGEFYVLSNEEKISRSNGVLFDQLFSLPMLASGMVAYAAAKKKDVSLAKKAWNLLLNEQMSHMVLPIKEDEVYTWRVFKEIPSVTTNTTSQWCLNVIVALELIGDFLSMEDDKKVHVSEK